MGGCVVWHRRGNFAYLGFAPELEKIIRGQRTSGEVQFERLAAGEARGTGSGKVNRVTWMQKETVEKQAVSFFIDHQLCFMVWFFSL